MARPRRMAPRGWAFSPFGFAKRVLVGAYEDNIAFLASALTFDALMWLLPFFLVTLSVFGYVIGGGEETIADVHAFLDRYLPLSGGADPLRRVEEGIARVVESRAQLSLVGAPFFLWLSMRLFGSVRAALNEVFDTEETRPYYVGKLYDLGLALVSAVLITANAVASVLVLQSPWFGRFIAALSTFAFSALLFYVIYTLAPSRPVRWDTALVASVVASLVFEAAKRFYAVYLANFVTLDRVISNANVIALLLFVLWVYLTALIFLAGGEVAETYDLARRQREQRAMLS